jgi:hypothetical protein
MRKSRYLRYRRFLKVSEELLKIIVMSFIVITLFKSL